jgi:predicted MPP superfamily phosphohydrolase
MRAVKFGMIFVGIALAAVLVYGAFIEPSMIDRRDETAEIPGLPAAWEGKRIAVIADLQVGMWLSNTATVRRIASLLASERPEVVLIAGDFVYHPLAEETVEETIEEREPEEIREVYDEIREAVDLIRPLLQAEIPVYAVLGNHDYGMQTRDALAQRWLADEVRRFLEEAGVKVLENEAVALATPAGRLQDGPENPAERLHLLGIGSHYVHNDKPETALAAVPPHAPRVVLMHNPDSFPLFPARTAPFAVAAHTHGGQIRIPFTPHWSWMSMIEKDEVKADGWIEDGYGQSGNRLYVNRGIGFSLLPIRINAAPEVTFFTLRRPAS